jgi:hypothetical protein
MISHNARSQRDDKVAMRARYFTPLAAFLVPSLVIGFGMVIPGSCIEGVNQLTVGFASSLAGAVASYWLGIRAVLSDRPREPGPR